MITTVDTFNIVYSLRKKQWQVVLFEFITLQHITALLLADRVNIQLFLQHILILLAHIRQKQLIITYI